MNVKKIHAVKMNTVKIQKDPTTVTVSDAIASSLNYWGANSGSDLNNTLLVQALIFPVKI